MSKAQKSQAPAADPIPEVQPPVEDAPIAEQSNEPENKPKTEVAGKIKVRVLVDCEVGKCNQVVEVEEKALKSLEGKVDRNPEAVAYALSLLK